MKGGNDVGSRVHGAASACLVACGLFLCGLGGALALAEPSASDVPPGTQLDGVRSLRELALQNHDLFARVVAEKLLTYALGRGLDYEDMPLVRSITRSAAENDYRFSSLLMAVVQSQAFTMNTKTIPNTTTAANKE